MVTKTQPNNQESTLRILSIKYYQLALAFAAGFGHSAEPLRKASALIPAADKHGVELSDFQDISGAIRYARASLRFDVNNESARKLLGLCLYVLGEYGAAILEFKRLTDSTKLADAATDSLERERAALKKARYLIKMNKWRKAEAVLRQVSHQSVRILIIRGCIYAAEKHYSEAAKLFSLALENDRGNRAAQFYLTEAMKENKYWWRRAYELLRNS